MKKYNAVIFDLDGVICHTENIIIKHGKQLQMNWESILMKKSITDSEG